MKTVKLLRSELYQQVWSTPMVQLAKTYGLSDVGLAKICKKHDVPRPPRGYWAKLQHGKKSKREPLPGRRKDYEIEMHDPSECRIKSPELHKEVSESVSVESEPEKRITVNETLRGSHPVVRASNERLQRAKTDDVGFIIPEGIKLDVTVSKQALHRALLIIDAILKAVDERGYQTGPGPTVTILETTITFSISEQTDTVKEEPEDPDLEGRYVFGHSRFREKRVPSGRLVLQIDDADSYWARGCRQTWRDGKKQRLENRLNSFLSGLIEVAARKREHEEEQARREEERQQERQREEAEYERRVAIYAKARKERERVDDLFMRAEAWELSNRLRAFIEAETQKQIRKHGKIEPGTEFAEWREWAIKQADRQDPLKESPPSILDEDDGRDEPKCNRWGW